MKKIDTAQINATTGYKGSKTNDKVVSTGTTPGKDSLNTGKFLSNVYKKVYGSLGVLSKPSNSKSRANSGLDARSVNRMLSALRSYLKYRIEFDLDIPIAPDAIKLIKAEKKKSQVAELSELVKLIECPIEFETKKDVGIRNRTMLELLFSTGMRISELVNLNLDQINLEGKLFILGKGKKQRFVYLTPRALGWLDKYLEVRFKHAFVEDRETSNANRTSDNMELKFDKYKYIEMLEQYRKSGYITKFSSPALFIPFNGRRSGKENTRISTNYFQERIAIYRKRIGILVPTSAHSLRHGFATYLAENGANPAAIQILLGHESLNTTTRYVHASDKYAQDTVKDKHPLK
ncbi:tyrosine-type recombinase/integrase [Candidatus Dojkabacteria bacterium]|nr:tyrosine-type recombinase/integrase [Candidatus Dojkabacteria bacterium]